MKKILLTPIGIVVSIGVLVLAVYWFINRGHVGPPTPGRSITYVDGPLRSDGYVDYFAAWNEMQFETVDPEANAAIDLMLAVGPDSPGSAELFFEKLDLAIAELPDGHPRKAIGDDHQSFVSLRVLVDSLSRSEADSLIAAAVDKDDETPLKVLYSQQSETQVRPWTPEEFPLIKRWLDENTTMFEFAERGNNNYDDIRVVVGPLDVVPGTTQSIE